MADNIWKGDALAVAQVQTYTFGGTWEADDYVRITIGSKTINVVAGSTTTNTVVDNVVTAFNALDTSLYPEFAAITASRSSSNLVLTADDEGVPFTATITPLESDYSAAGAQTIEGAGTATTGTAATACSGPHHWDTAANWSAGTVPANTEDVYIENSTSDILYGFAQTAVTLTSLNIAASFTGTIGLPEVNAAGYYEYRATYLAIKATTVNVGTGIGSGSGRIKWDGSTAQTTLNVRNTATSAESGRSALLFKGTHASNAVNVSKGSVGIAELAGEVATVATLRVGFVSNVEGDATVYCGPGVTLTTISQAGGELTVQSNATTITRTAGTLHHRGGTITTVTSDGGSAYFYGTGTITTQNVGSGATHDFSRDMRTRTVTTTNVYEGATLYDPFNTVTFTNGFTLVRCNLGDVTVNTGQNKTYTPS